MRRSIRWLAVAVILVAAVAWSRAGSTGNGAKLYVTNSLGDDITVIDLASLNVVGDIKVGKDVHGACAPADGRWLFTTIESENNLKIIDTATDKIVRRFPSPAGPTSAPRPPDGHFV